MGCCSSKPEDDGQSEGPINEARPRLNEPHYDNVNHPGNGNHSPPTPSPNEPGPHEIGVAVTTPDNTAAQQQQKQDNYFSPGSSEAPQIPVMLPETAARDENSQENTKARSHSSSSSSSSSNRDAGRAEGGNRG